LSRSESLEKTRKLYRDFFGEKPEKIASVPGRLDFLNTHQDHKGLPVVSISVNLRCYTAVSSSSDERGVAVSFNYMEEGLSYYDEFSLKELEPVGREGFSGYLRVAVKVLLEKGCGVRGFRAGIYSEVPIASGMGSSAALTASFIAALNALFELGLSESEIAEYAYIAEHDVLGIPCERLDQYGCVYGGVALIRTRPPYSVERLPRLSGVFTVVDSGVRHRTADVHPRRQGEIEEGLKLLMEMDIPGALKTKLGYRYWEPEWVLIELEEIEPFLRSPPETPRKRILFTLKMHASTLLALGALRGESLNTEVLGEVEEAVRSFTGKTPAMHSREEVVGAVMTYQHMLLRGLYDVSIPVPDDLVISAVDSGAYGAKLSGAGLGGVVIALAESVDRAQEIIRKSLKAGGTKAWIVGFDEGVMAHE